jgi:hypothetical protein
MTGDRISKIHEAGQLQLDPARGYHDRNVCRVVHKIGISGKDGSGGVSGCGCSVQVGGYQLCAGNPGTCPDGLPRNGQEMGIPAGVLPEVRILPAVDAP